MDANYSINRNEIRLVFVDLDLTLFDYTNSREKGAKNALKALGTKNNYDQLMQNYLYILDHWKGFKYLGLPDIRRYWNDSSIYTLTYIFTSPDINFQTSDLFDLIIKIEESAEDIQTLNQILDRNYQIIDLLQDIYNTVSNNTIIQKYIEQAKNNFNNATSKLEPFSGARRLLTGLKKAGFHGFILTEGDYTIQSDKIRKLGFSDIISKDGVIITDELSAVNNILNQIEKLKGDYIKQLGSDPDADGMVEIQIDSIEFIQKLFLLFEQKKNKHFYGHAIHIAIKRVLGYSTNNEFPDISPEEWNALPPIKLATLGDRYSNDIKPLIEIFGQKNVLSIQMLYGKYKHENPGDSDIKPDYSVQDLDAALNLLLNNNNWSKIGPIFRPNHFFISDHNLLLNSAVGLTIPDPVSSISESIMRDLGFDQDRINSFRGRILNEFINKTTKTVLIKRLKEAIT